MEDQITTVVAEHVSRLPRYGLAQTPTSLEPLATEIPGFQGRLLVKRDDCTGLALGGNKSRKLEFTLGDAVAKHANVLLTASGVQSNHVRQTAAAAAKAELRFHAVLAPALSQIPRAHLESGNMLLDMLFGAQLHLVSDADLADAKLQQLFDAETAAGAHPYIIPLGASDGVGSIGYVSCALELLEQFAAQHLDVSHIFLPTGSGGTHGGLLAGLRLAGCDASVVGISVSEPASVKIAKVRASIDGVAQVLGLDPAVRDEDIIVFDDYAGDGYGHPTESANAWVKRVALADGLLLDPIYTGKAFAGMADLLAGGRLGTVRDVVFLHTGGVAALFADPRLLCSPEIDAPEIVPLYGTVVD